MMLKLTDFAAEREEEEFEKLASLVIDKAKHDVNLIRQTAELLMDYLQHAEGERDDKPIS